MTTTKRPAKPAKVAAGGRRNAGRRTDTSARPCARGKAPGTVNDDHVVTFEQMTDAQKRIAAAGSAESALPVPDLPKDQLTDYFLKRIVAARAVRGSRDH